jgi:hypothetical protein
LIPADIDSGSLQPRLKNVIVPHESIFAELDVARLADGNLKTADPVMILPAGEIDAVSQARFVGAMLLQELDVERCVKCPGSAA